MDFSKDISSKKKSISINQIKEMLNTNGSYGFVMESEKEFHNKIMQAVHTIINTAQTKRIVFLAGPSGSGKTTTANMLKTQLENYGIPVLRISMDDYFLSLGDRLHFSSFEDPQCLDMQLLKEHIPALLEGKKVRSPRYNFVRGISEYGPTISLPSDGIIICEGIHALNSGLFNEFKGLCKGIYVAPRTRIVLDTGEIFEPQQLRLARRILRDSRTRGRTAQQVIQQSTSVDEGEKQYIDPFKEKASIHIDTFLNYELCVIAKILFEENYMKTIEKESTLYRTLLAIPKEIEEKCVPKDSILKEFIG